MKKHFLVEVEYPEGTECNPIDALKSQIEKGSPERPVFTSKVMNELYPNGVTVPIKRLRQEFSELKEQVEKALVFMISTVVIKDHSVTVTPDNLTGGVSAKEANKALSILSKGLTEEICTCAVARFTTNVKDKRFQIYIDKECPKHNHLLKEGVMPEYLKFETYGVAHQVILEEECDCPGYEDEELPNEDCNLCDGTGIKLTENGEQLLKFILKFKD